MTKTLQQQIIDTITASNQVLIVFKESHSPDAVASALALKMLLEKMKKHVDVVCNEFKLAPHFMFLPESHCIKDRLDGLQQFKICLDTKNVPLKDLSYNHKDNELQILVTPKSGVYQKHHIKTEEGAYKYDLIITLDTEDLESLGSLFNDHSDFFYTTTIVNIDHKPENEEFGQINHLDYNVTSNAEIIYNLLREITQESLMDEKIAQCLLCGIISKTKSFKSINVTPQTLHTASLLIEAGADRDEIIKNLYYTKSIATLKLWGKVLSRLKSVKHTDLAWSFIEQKDFETLHTSPTHLTDVIEELILTAPEAKIIALFYEYNNTMHGMLYSNTSYSSKDLMKKYSPFGSKRLATFKLKGANILDTGQSVIDELHSTLRT